MAREIRVEFGVNVTKGGNKLVERAVERTSVSMDGEFASSEVQMIGTVVEPLDIGADIAIEGFGAFKNLDVSVHNTIQLGTMDGSDFHPFAEFHVGDPRCLIPLFTLDLYAKATLAPAKLQFDIFER
jgi:hypothetical protein